MSSVMIRCPMTGRAVSAEIETEPGVFRQLPNIRARMHCPACGREHMWRVNEAWLDGEPRLAQAAPAASPEAA